MLNAERQFSFIRVGTNTQTHMNGCFRFYFKQRNWRLKHENRLFSSYTRTTYRLIRKLKTRLLLFLFCSKQLVGLSNCRVFVVRILLKFTCAANHHQQQHTQFIQQTAVKQTRTNSRLSDFELEFDVKCHRWTNKHGN